MTDISRSWTDAITNDTLLSGFDIAQYLKWVEKRPVSVNEVLSHFLHEYTHHWCFHSIVGNAIALLRMRALRKCLLPRSPENIQLLTDDLIRYQTAEIMLQPFSEGLALFAEFDARPGDGPIVSQTMAAATMCFGFPVGERESSAVEKSLTALLQNVRPRREFLDRKAGILALHMAVKSLLTYMTSVCPTLEDRDLFLSFIRSYIYEDPNLVLTILSDERDEVRAGEAIANYILKRFWSLLGNGGLSSSVDTWASSVAEGGFDVSSIGASEQALSEAEFRMIRLVEDAAGEGTQSDLAAYAFATWQERRFLTLGTIKVKVQAAGGKALIRAIDDTEISYELKAGPAPGEHDGYLIVVVPSSASCLLVLLVVHPQCFVVRQFGKLHESGLHSHQTLQAAMRALDADWEPIERYAVNRTTSDDIHRYLEAELNREIESSAAHIFLSHNKRNALRAADHLYGALSTLYCPDDACDKVLKYLRDGGLLALLDGNALLLRGLAAIGLSNTITTDVFFIRGFARLMDISEETINDTLKTAQERHGMKLLVFRDQQAIALL